MSIYWGGNFSGADGFDVVLEYCALSFDAFDDGGSNFSLGARYGSR